MRRAGVVGGAVLLILLLSLAPAVAQSESRPAPPAGLVLEITEVQEYGGGSPSVQAWFTLTFPLSAQDPGAFEYNLYFLDDSGSFGQFNIGVSAIAGRSGWVSFTNDFSTGSGLNSAYTLYVTANNTAAEESAYSCGLAVDFRAPAGTHYQCGSRSIAPPAGVSAVVQSISSEADNQGTIEVRWIGSPDDPDPSEYDYALYRRSSDGTGGLSDWFLVSADAGTALGNGVFVHNVTDAYRPGATFRTEFRVQARDAVGTNLWSDPSCIAGVTGGVLFDASGCGQLAPEVGGLAPGGPSFPFTNISAVAEGSGMSVGAVGAFLGVGTVLGIAAMGFMMAGVVGAVAGGATALAFIAVTGLLPLYVLILVFLGAVALMVMKLKGGSE